ncbi:MAG: hypothetical protein AAB701_03130 [Patescibacteria group bacterium]
MSREIAIATSQHTGGVATTIDQPIASVDVRMYRVSFVRYKDTCGFACSKLDIVESFSSDLPLRLQYQMARVIRADVLSRKGPLPSSDSLSSCDATNEDCVIVRRSQNDVALCFVSELFRCCDPNRPSKEDQAISFWSVEQEHQRNIAEQIVAIRNATQSDGACIDFVEPLRAQVVLFQGM